jgi:hypothetical protein
VFDVVDALEALGSDADLVDGPSASLDSILQREGVEPALRRALVEGDACMLHALLRAPKSVCSYINPAEEEEVAEDDEQDEGDEDGADDEDDVNSWKGPKPPG